MFPKTAQITWMPSSDGSWKAQYRRKVKQRTMITTDTACSMYQGLSIWPFKHEEAKRRACRQTGA